MNQPTLTCLSHSFTCNVVIWQQLSHGVVFTSLMSVRERLPVYLRLLCFYKHLSSLLLSVAVDIVSFSDLGNYSFAFVWLRRLPSDLAFSLEVLLNQFRLLFGVETLPKGLGYVFILACVVSLHTHLVNFIQNLRPVIDAQLFEKLLDVGRSLARHCSLLRS